MLQECSNHAIITTKETINENKKNVSAPQTRPTIQYKKKVEYYRDGDMHAGTTLWMH